MQQSLSDMKTCAAIEHHLPCAMLQYNPAPGSHGSVKFLYARIADIFMGTIITSLFTLVLPWSVPPPHHSLQQSHHLPSTVTFSRPSSCLNSPSICLQQSPYLPSTVPPLAYSGLSTCLQQLLHLPSAVPTLAYIGPSTCLQQTLSQSPHGHAASC